MVNEELLNQVAAHTVIKYPLSTEKAVRMMEADNKMIFVVERRATKLDIKDAVQTIFGAKPMSINTIITPKGQKRAIVRFGPDKAAVDIATEMGLI